MTATRPARVQPGEPTDPRGADGRSVAADVPGRPPVRLSRDVILEAALRIGEQRTDHPAQVLSGQSLGAELAVDRSAIWRHFSNKDDLLLAVADRLLGLVLDEVDLSGGPRQRLSALLRTTVEVFVRYPRIGGQLGSRTVAGPHGMRVAEEMIGVFVEAGMSGPAAVLHYRAFADLGLAYAAMCAQHSLRPGGTMHREAQEYAVAIARLDPTRFPLLTAYGAELLAVDDTQVADVLLDLLWAEPADRTEHR